MSAITHAHLARANARSRPSPPPAHAGVTALSLLLTPSMLQASQRIMPRPRPSMLSLELSRELTGLVSHLEVVLCVLSLLDPLFGHPCLWSLLLLTTFWGTVGVCLSVEDPF